MNMTSKITKFLAEGSGTPGVDMAIVKRVRFYRSRERYTDVFIEIPDEKTSDDWVINRAVMSQLRRAGERAGREDSGTLIKRYRETYTPRVTDVSDTVDYNDIRLIRL